MSKWDNKFTIPLGENGKLTLKDRENYNETRTLKIQFDSNFPNLAYEQYEVLFNKKDYTLLEEKAKTILLAILKSMNAGEKEISLTMKYLNFIIDGLTHAEINTK